MKLNKYIVIFLIVIFLILINYNNFFNNYYKSINDAVENNSNYKILIDIFWVNEKPLAFYQTNDNRVCLVHFVTKSNNDEKKYKIAYQEYIGVSNPYSVLAYNSFDINNKSPDDKLERILYGITSNKKEIAINNIQSKIINFDNNGQKYYLWYIIGGKELDEYSNKKI